MTVKERAEEALRRVANASIELVAHLIVLTVLLAGIWLLEKFVHVLWGEHDYLFFQRLKLRYLFDGADLALIAGFLVWGVYSAIAAYVRKP